MNKKREKTDRAAARMPSAILIIAAMAICLAAFFLAMIFGAADTSLRDVWLALTSGAKTPEISIIRELRLPREVACLLVGSALAVAGAIMQGVTRNPLADPGLFGLTAGAKAALAITLALIPGANYFYIMLACFAGAGLGTVFVFGIAALKRGGFSPLRIVLAGAAVSAFLFAVADGIGLYFKIARDVSMWTSGGLIGTTWSQIRIIAPFIGAGIVAAMFLARQLTLLSFDEEVATGLGQRTGLVKTLLFVIVAVLAGTSVALAGNLAFVGLMIPHMVRPFTGNDYRLIIPVSILIGGAFMLAADTIGRTLQAPFETPIAAIIALLGLPFFLYVVRKGGRSFS